MPYNFANMSCLYWGVRCKNAKCYKIILAKYAGAPNFVLAVSAPEWTDYQCPACRATHRYGREELVQVETPLPPRTDRMWFKLSDA